MTKKLSQFEKKTFVVLNPLTGRNKWFNTKQGAEDFLDQEDRNNGLMVQKGVSIKALDTFPEIFSSKISLSLEMINSLSYSFWEVDEKEVLLVIGGPAHRRTSQLYSISSSRGLELVNEMRVYDLDKSHEEIVLDLFYKDKWSKIKRIFIHDIPPQLRGKEVSMFDPRLTQKELKEKYIETLKDESLAKSISYQEKVFFLDTGINEQNAGEVMEFFLLEGKFTGGLITQEISLLRAINLVKAGKIPSWQLAIFEVEPDGKAFYLEVNEVGDFYKSWDPFEYSGKEIWRTDGVW